MDCEDTENNKGKNAFVNAGREWFILKLVEIHHLQLNF